MTGMAGTTGGRGRGRFIAFEGGEASGKSTQARLLATRTGAVLTREPGGTETGRRIRDLVLDPATELHPRTEALLLLADRAQHVHEVVAPALARGSDVVTDRFSGSTLAYQGYGRGLDLADLTRLSGWATGGVEPDVIVLLDVPGKVARGRQEGRPLDRMEGTGDAFHDRVREGYLALAAADPDGWVVVDGAGPEDDVAANVWAAVCARCGVEGRIG